MFPTPNLRLTKAILIALVDRSLYGHYPLVTPEFLYKVTICPIGNLLYKQPKVTCWGLFISHFTLYPINLLTDSGVLQYRTRYLLKGLFIIYIKCTFFELIIPDTYVDIAFYAFFMKIQCRLKTSYSIIWCHWILCLSHENSTDSYDLWGTDFSSMEAM